MQGITILSPAGYPTNHSLMQLSSRDVNYLLKMSLTNFLDDTFTLCVLTKIRLIYHSFHDLWIERDKRERQARINLRVEPRTNGMFIMNISNHDS